MVAVLHSTSQEVNKIAFRNFAETVTLGCQVKGVKSNALLDSGAGCSLMTNDVYDRIPNAALSPADRTLKDASQNTINLLGKT